MSEHPEDQRYREIILKPIDVCAQYKPKFGQGRGEGLSLETFQRLYKADAFYSWFGLDNPLMYAAHKAAGGMTSIYRQIGIGGERLFRQILIDTLGLSEEDATWWYKRETRDGKRQKLYLDGRIPIHAVSDEAARGRISDWVQRAAEDVGVQQPIIDSLTGIVFEVRQGYKSKDSKRQNADIANAASAYINTYLPCAVILSNQIDGDIQSRYRGERWAMVTGTIETDDDLRSTYAFTRQVLGYDLAAFFERNAPQLRTELERILQSLLKAG